ncbi:MAG: hypothetical protein H0X46_07585, partial [Bacteroidetes bacterium]|nr:hypothetical protein [Bacteroidota bacterium]
MKIFKNKYVSILILLCLVTTPTFTGCKNWKRTVAGGAIGAGAGGAIGGA